MNILLYSYETRTIGKYERGRLKATEIRLKKKTIVTRLIEYKTNETVLDKVNEKGIIIKIKIIGYLLKRNQFIMEGKIN